jgi:hypothetical protein
LNCFLEDKYARASYALAFTHPDFEKPELLLAFEVLEHFENPRSDLHMLFQNNPKALLASTVRYSTQDSKWWYLTPETGQHVFFYSRAAMRLIAKQWGFDVVERGYYWLFIRSGTVGRVRKALASVVLTRPVLRLVGAFLRLMPTPAVTRDLNSLRSRDV